jgi:probable F420-dependent oxidoreductase
VTIADNRPRLSIALPVVSADETDHLIARRVLDVASLLEEVGVDRVVVPDHVAFGESLDAYGDPRRGGVEGGTQPTGPDGIWLEPMTMLAAVAAVTSRIRLGTVVLQAALRRPIVLAKTASTLDVLSGGRLDLGVGIGWQRAEYDAAGLRFDRRGRLLDHTLSVCTEVWRNRVACLSDAHLTFAGVHQMPKPLQPGGVPLWISGSFHPRVIARVAQFGAGWIPWGLAAKEIVATMPLMRDALADAGRDPATIRVMARLRAARTENDEVDANATFATAGQMIDAGVTDFRLRVSIPENRDAALDLFSTLVESFRTSTATRETT